MEFEWDENKRQRNIRTRNLDFIQATRLFDGRPTFTYESPRSSEIRWGTVGLLDIEGKTDFYLAVWTLRSVDTVRIISFYRADDWEIRAYHALHGGRH